MSRKCGVPTLPNLEPIIAAGIDPVTGLPLKIASQTPENLKPFLKRGLTLVDEQDAINRYVWHNLPGGLSSNLIERILYYKGQGAFFYLDTLERFFFLPYALDGNIDVYGRYMGITPLPFGNGTTENEDPTKPPKPWIDGLIFSPIYDIILPEDLKLEDLTKRCVLIHDYSQEISPLITPRKVINECLVDLESDCLPYLKTALMNSTGITGLRVDNEGDTAQVYNASAALENAALTGQKFVPLVGPVEMQELVGGQVNKAEEFLLAMQSIDNLRLSQLGLENGGLFQKKAHELQSEANMTGSSASSTLQDGLEQRQEACNLINSIWGIGVWCEVKENAVGLDQDGDGMAAENQDQSGTTNNGTPNNGEEGE